MIEEGVRDILKGRKPVWEIKEVENS